jgi:hypothetical protein
MPIRFSQDRWPAIQRSYTDWWSGANTRPLFHIAAQGYDPGRPKPELQDQSHALCLDCSVPPEEVIDTWDWEASRWEWLGDAFPIAFPYFGAGALAAMVGAQLIPTHETIWFDIPDSWRGECKPIDEIELTWDPENVWVKRVSDLMRAAMERWDGLVQVGMTDLGGTFDVMSTFRPSERLLLDLIDSPDEVHRFAWNTHDMWWKAFDHLSGILQPTNPGYTAWTPVFSETPYYILQCDFCYMIGPDMFDEFVKPEIVASCKRLGNAIYHLDGPGQLAHLDSLLEIDELQAFQWVPTTGGPMHDKWPDVYRKIHDAGKYIQLEHMRAADGRWHIDVISEQIGSTEGLIVMGRSDISELDEVHRLLDRYGAG